jgi:hypothetical protein
MLKRLRKCAESGLFKNLRAEMLKVKKMLQKVLKVPKCGDLIQTPCKSCHHTLQLSWFKTPVWNMRICAECHEFESLKLLITVFKNQLSKC